MAISKPITRVEQYLAHISGMRVNVPEVPLTREEMYLAAWARKSGIEDTEMQGEPPLTLKDCIGEPFNGLVLYGKSTQVTTTGAQLFEPISNKLNSNGITITFDENGEKIVVSGTSESSQAFQISKPIRMQAGEKYVLTIDEAHQFENTWLRSSNGVNFGWFGKNTNNRLIITVPDSIAERTDCVMYASTSKGIAYNFTINHLMLNAGDTALPWEPYTGGKPSPSPDYPQEIVSAGEDGSVTVKVTGRNILDMRNSKESVANSGVTYTRNADYSFTRTGTATEASGNVWMAGGYLVKPKADLSNVFCVLLKGVKYSIKDCVLLTVSPAGNVLAARNENFVPTQDMYITGVRNENFIVGETYNDIVYPAVYVGEKALQYEPYREQLLTIPTPNGLPGIPVTSGGNYTDENGQQWICDELDFERGVYRQRIGCKEYLDASGWKHSITSKFKNHNFQTRLSNSDTSAGINGRCYCNLLSYKNTSWDDVAINLPKIYAHDTEITVSFPPDTNMDSIEKWDELLKKTSLQIQYILETTIETPLSEADIAAYRALTTYKGTTILESECCLKVKYFKLRK